MRSLHQAAGVDVNDLLAVMSSIEFCGPGVNYPGIPVVERGFLDDDVCVEVAAAVVVFALQVIDKDMFLWMADALISHHGTEGFQDTNNAVLGFFVDQALFEHDGAALTQM